MPNYPVNYYHYPLHLKVDTSGISFIGVISENNRHNRQSVRLSRLDTFLKRSTKTEAEW